METQAPTTPNKNANTIKVIVTALVIGAGVWYFYGGGLEAQADKEMTKIENQVAVDAVKEYEIAKSGGDAMQIYTAASMVTASYLQANDQVNYKKWLAVEQQAAKDAGLSE